MRTGSSRTRHGRRRASGGLIAAVALLTAGLVMLVGPSGGSAAAGRQADLFLNMADKADPVFVHGALAYSLDVGNAGPDLASGVVLTVRYPKGATFQSATQGQGTCRPHRAVHRVVCRLKKLASGAGVNSPPIHVAIHLQAPKQPGTISATGIVKSGVHDPNRANNRHVETTALIARPAPATCQGERAGIVGTSGDDTLNGGEGDNVVAALGGNDQIFPDGGSDLVCAAGGDDLVVAGSGDDRIYGGDQIDRIQGEGDDDNLRGGDGPDVILGGDGADIVRGQLGTDVLRGRDGNDILRGGPKVDALYGGRGNDILIGGAGHDHCFGGAGHNTYIHCAK